MFFALLATGYVLIQHKGIQNKIIGIITSFVSDKLHTRFTIQEVDIAFPYRLKFADVYLEDLNGDTLLYAKSLTAGVNWLNPLNKVVKLNAINLNEAYFNLYFDSLNTHNLQFILNLLKPKEDVGKTGWTAQFNNIKLKKSRFTLQLYPYKETEYGINFTRMKLSDINASLHHFVPSKDSTSFKIRSLSFKEESGFITEKVKADFSLSKHFLKLHNISIETPSSTVFCKKVDLLFDSWQDYKAGGFYEKVALQVEISNSNLYLAELGYFAPAFRNMEQHINIAGKSKGTVNNLKVKDINIRFGSNSLIQGNLGITGLPLFREAFIIADFKQFRTTREDIINMRLPQNKSISLNNRFNKLGTVTYRGRFTGFMNDFVAFGTFNTSLGVVSSDLLIKPDTADYLSFNGKVTALNFNLGALIDRQENVGQITMVVNAKGNYSSNNLILDLKGLINSFSVNNYQYNNIEIAGLLNNRAFNGSVYVNDKNVNLDFTGKVDFSNETPSYNFTANVTQANLQALNLYKTGPPYNISFFIEADATGNSFKNLNGEVKLLNSLFVKNDQQLQIYDITLQAENNPEKQSLTLRSDFVDAELTGNYDLSKASETFKKLLLTYLPSLVDSGFSFNGKLTSDMKLSAKFKHTAPIFDFFLPDYFIAENTELNVSFNPKKQEIYLFCNAPYIKIKNFKWNEYHLLVIGDSSKINFEAGGAGLVINNQINLENFTVKSDISGDSMNVFTRWNNWEEIVYRGSINASLGFSRSAETNQPVIAMKILPTSIITYDTLWRINQSDILISKGNIVVNNLTINHNNEYFRFAGKISSDPEDKLNLFFNNFNLGNLNTLTQSEGFVIEGILNGRADFSSLFDNPLFVTHFTIDSLVINNEKLGSAQIISLWNNRNKSIEIQANALREKLKTIDIEGSYFVSNHGLDFDIQLNKLRMNLFNPYVDKLADNLRGMASGSLTLKGTVEKPVFNGEITLQKAAFTVKYLQTRYNLSDKIEIINNNISFSNVKVFDNFGNAALLTGNIRNRYLKDFQFNFSIKADNLLFLNTRSTDNKLFYGTAFATGTVNISGTPKNIEMNISARTEKNTVFNIPLSREGELSEYNFVHFVRDNNYQTDEIEVINKYKVDLSGIRMNFDLEVTPDAEVQIIFDPKVGDIIKGSGSGNLNMKISTAGNFMMYGDFMIEKGDYLLTLQNVINKRFTIESGGKIIWNGDPFDASIDVKANYRARASLYELFGTEDLISQGKIPVDCQIAMTGKLMAPLIKYDINLPTSDEETKMKVKNAINSPDELNKQFISLLVLNSFYPRSSGATAGGSVSSPAYSNVAGVNASELLSNQLSNWLSQISNEVDVGLNYRADNRVRGEQQIEMTLSTQLFNDKLTINGSVDVDYSTNAAAKASSNIVGEFDIDYKLTKNGRLRLKTFNHSNNNLLYENSPYTQGFGVFYKEDFNTFGELLQRYWRAITGKKEENELQIRNEKNNNGT